MPEICPFRLECIVAYIDYMNCHLHQGTHLFFSLSDEITTCIWRKSIAVRFPRAHAMTMTVQCPRESWDCKNVCARGSTSGCTRWLLNSEVKSLSKKYWMSNTSYWQWHDAPLTLCINLLCGITYSSLAKHRTLLLHMEFCQLMWTYHWCTAKEWEASSNSSSLTSQNHNPACIHACITKYHTDVLLRSTEFWEWQKMVGKWAT